MEPLLEVKNLRTEFKTDDGIVKAVDDVSLTIQEKEIVGVVGESGCGKSVTQLSVMRLIRPPAGSWGERSSSKAGTWPSTKPTARR